MMKFVELSPRTKARIADLISARTATLVDEVFRREVDWLIHDVCHTPRSCGISGVTCDSTRIFFYEGGKFIASFVIMHEWKVVRMFLRTMLDHSSSTRGHNEGVFLTNAISGLDIGPNLRLVDIDATQSFGDAHFSSRTGSEYRGHNDPCVQKCQ